VDAVYEELDEAGMLDILSEGVTIQTSLDPNAQEAVESALNSKVFPNEKIQAGLTVLDTKTGEIVAIGGGRNFSTGFLNFAIKEKRQPGSVIKPILSYGPAIEYLDWSTGQTVHDKPYNYEGSKPAQAVRNVDRKYKGAIPMRDALYNSRNVPAVKTYEDVGRGKAVDFAAQLGLPFKNEFPSNALGGSDEFSTTQMAGAYAPFGNGGSYTKPHTIKKITYPDGKTADSLTPDSVAVMKDSTAYMVTDMLRDVLTKGTGKRAAVQGLDVAGKTGTTNFAEKSGAQDTWFAGYTTDYTIAVWGGYQDRSAMDERERYVPQDLFKTVMSSISTGKNTAKFKKPSSVEEAVIQYGSDPLVLANARTPANRKRTELFVKGTLPTVVSKQIEEVESLQAPTNLRADYQEESASVTLNWAHEVPDPAEIEGAVEFIVYASADGGAKTEIARTSGMSSVFTGVEVGKSYTFSVIATVGNLESSPASITLQIAEQEVVEEESEELEEPEEPIIEDDIDTEEPPVDPNSSDSGNDPEKEPGNNPGNGTSPDNGSSPGNGTPPSNGSPPGNGTPPGNGSSPGNGTPPGKEEDNQIPDDEDNPITP